MVPGMDIADLAIMKQTMTIIGAGTGFAQWNNGAGVLRQREGAQNESSA